MNTATAIGLVMLLQELLVGQIPLIEPPDKAPQTASVVSGTIRDAATGLPVPNATVQLESSTILPTTKSGTDGRYSFSGSFSGTLRLFTLNEKGYLQSGKRIEIVSGQHMTGIDFALIRSAVMGGRVLDSDKTPIVGGRVHVRREGFRNGRNVLLSSHTRPTNDLGEYRITNLPPGDYFVQITPRSLEFRPHVAPATPEAAETPTVFSNTVTYYPNSPTREGATPVTLRPGEVNEHVDMVVVRAKSVCLSTTLVVPAAWSSEEWIGIILAEPYPISQSKVAVGRFRQPGSIEVCGVTPGLYRLMASSALSDKTLLGFQSVSVSGSRALELPATHLDALRPVSGKVSIVSDETQEVQAAKKEMPTSLWINLEPKDRILFMGESPYVNVPPNGQFAIPAAALDAYWVEVGGLPAGYFVKSVRSGQQDAYSQAWQVGGGELEVVLGDHAASLSGMVTGADEQAVADAKVILVASSVATAIAPNQIFSAKTGPDGTFLISNVPPGRYNVVAARGVLEGQETSPEMARWAATVTTVDLAPREKKSLTLKAVVAGPQR